MADFTLHGNGRSCPACELRRAAQDLTLISRPPVPCNRCRGKGRTRKTDAQIVAETAAEARRSHWPAFYARTGCSPDRAPRPRPPPFVEPVQLSFAF